MTSSISLFELAVEAAVKIPFEDVDEFFISRGQLVPDELIVKCANSTLPSIELIDALSPHDDDKSKDCHCHEFRNINQSGFVIFATWSCRMHGSGAVQVKWSQKRVTGFSCSCTHENSTYFFMCYHASKLLLRRVEKCPDSMISQLAPLTNILMNLSEEELREVLLEVASWDISGKDLFDFDFGFEDPIDGIPDLTNESQSTSFTNWLVINPRFKYSPSSRLHLSLCKLLKEIEMLPEVSVLFESVVDYYIQKEPSSHHEQLIPLLLYLFQCHLCLASHLSKLKTAFPEESLNIRQLSDSCRLGLAKTTDLPPEKYLSIIFDEMPYCGDPKDASAFLKWVANIFVPAIEIFALESSYPMPKSSKIISEIVPHMPDDPSCLPRIKNCLDQAFPS